MRSLPLLLLAAGACGRMSSASEVDRGAELFGSICARCHGAEGGGGLPVPTGQTPRNFRDPEFQKSRNDGDIRRVIVQGKPPGMPAFGTAFNAGELDALVRHVRSCAERR